jgi:hypothetical protein
MKRWSVHLKLGREADNTAKPAPAYAQASFAVTASNNAASATSENWINPECEGFIVMVVSFVDVGLLRIAHRRQKQH